MKLTAIKRLVEEKKMHMEVIVNNKVRDYDGFQIAIHTVQTYLFNRKLEVMLFGDNWL